MKASWEEEFDKIWNKDRFEEIGFTFSDFEFVKQFIRKQLEKQREELLERIREEVLIEDIGSDVVAWARNTQIREQREIVAAIEKEV